MGSIAIGWWILGAMFAAFAIYMVASRLRGRRAKSGEEEPKINSTNSLLR